MRKLDKNSRRGVVNLFADFILSKIGKEKNSKLQVIDCNNFFVVLGVTNSKEILDLQKIKKEFYGWFDDIIENSGIEAMNIIDLIKYNVDVPSFDEGWFELNKDFYSDKDDSLNNLSYNSEFPHGYSFNCGRIQFYYSNYIFNQIYNLLGIKNLKFFYTNKINMDDDLSIDLISNSKIPKDKIISLILDVFDFNIEEFKNLIGDYDLTMDILDQTKNKRYLVQDKLEHLILF